MIRDSMILQRYLEKHALHPSLLDPLLFSSIETIVVIPALMEDHLESCLLSLAENEDIDFSKLAVICLLNYKANYAEERHVQNFYESQLKALTALQSTLPFTLGILGPMELKGKNAGVGMARKILMDEAIRIFCYWNKSNGIIINLDGDCLVSRHYLFKIKGYFNNENAKPAVSIGFKHRFDGLSSAEKEAGKIYEFHLNDYVRKQKKYEYEFAFHTLGSCFAVQAEAYCRQGGMNQKQAGEDFYFLHKFSRLDLLGEIDEALVYPLARVSDRVPFGTGRAVSQIVNGKVWTSYNEEAIKVFVQLGQDIDSLYEADDERYAEFLSKLNVPLQKFLENAQLDQVFNENRRNTADILSFKKRMKRYFSPFLLMKWLHFARENGFPDEEIGLFMI